MEKNLPFGSLPFADKGYNKFVLPFLGKLDEGNIFKNIITKLLGLLAITFLLGGIYISFAGLFGYNGYIESYIGSDYLGLGKKIGAIVGLVFGLVLSVIASWFLYSVLKKRTAEIQAIEYNGLLDFIFVKTTPRIILVAGELIFVVLIYTGLLQIIAALVGSYVYAPLAEFSPNFNAIFFGSNMSTFSYTTQISGDYYSFGDKILTGIVTIVFAFIILVLFYIYKEIYNYLLKLVINLLGFLPKFAIPLSLRKREEK